MKTRFPNPNSNLMTRCILAKKDLKEALEKLEAARTVFDMPIKDMHHIEEAISVINRHLLEYASIEAANAVIALTGVDFCSDCKRKIELAWAKEA